RAPARRQAARGRRDARAAPGREAQLALSFVVTAPVVREYTRGETMPALLMISGPAAGLRVEVKDEATLGRSPSCEIPLEDSKVSRHAKVFVKEGQTRITDL